MEALAARHAPLLFDELGARELYEFIPDDPPTSVASLTRRFEALAGGAPGDELWRNWVMRSRDDDRPVGTLQATVYPDHRAAIAYLVLPRVWRRGYATEGVAWMLEALRAVDAVTRAVAVIDTRNAASIGLVETLGFHRVQTIFAAATFNGRASDEHTYQRSLA